jgi:hypothetical protein
MLSFGVDTNADQWEIWCPGGYLCDVNTNVVCGSGISAGQWYTYSVYFNLPPDSSSGEIACWIDGVEQEFLTNVQTEPTAGWEGYDVVRSGITRWAWFTSDGIWNYTDDLEDCRCKVYGNATPVPPTPIP